MRIRLVFFLSALLASCSMPAWCDELRLIPSLSVSEQYNDNILFTPNDKIRDFITTLSPGLGMTDRTERMDTELLARIDRLEYANNPDRDGTGYLYNGTATYRASELFSFSTGVSYAEYANPTLVTGLSGITTITSPWHQITASASANYQYTEKTGVIVSYSYGKDYYEGSQSTNDYISQEANAGFTYDFGKYISRLKARLNAGYSTYQFPGSNVENAMATVGFSRDIDEAWGILIDGGIRRTWSEVLTQQFVPSTTIVVNGDTIPIAFYAADVTVSKGGWGAVGNASLSYRGERAQGSLTYTRDLAPAPGLNGTAERNATTLSAERKLTDKLSVSLSLGYYLLSSDTSQFSAEVNKQNTSDVNTAIHYTFSRDTFIEASYDNSWIEYPVAGTVARRQSVYLHLSTQYPLFE